MTKRSNKPAVRLPAPTCKRCGCSQPSVSQLDARMRRVIATLRKAEAEIGRPNVTFAYTARQVLIAAVQEMIVALVREFAPELEKDLYR